MATADEQLALEYLSREYLLHINMIGPITRGTALILYTADNGVMIKETASGAFMISASSPDIGRRLVKEAYEMEPDAEMFLVHQSFMREILKEHHPRANFREVLTAAYLSTDRLPTIPEMSIQTLDDNSVDIIMRHYSLGPSEEYIRGRIAAKDLFGAFVEGEMIGFGGIHAEGSLGMLEIFEEYRRMGYATSVAGFGVNLQLDRGLVPFSCVKVENTPSIYMHKKLGFTMSDSSVWWLLLS